MITSDPDIAGIQLLTGSLISVSDYANHNYIPDHNVLPPEVKRICVTLMLGDKAANVDAQLSGTAWLEDRHRDDCGCDPHQRALVEQEQGGERDPEMHQARKSKQWYFGMKAHVGVDAATKLIHPVAATAANVADCRLVAELLHGEESDFWGDQAYQGQAAILPNPRPKPPTAATAGGGPNSTSTRRCANRTASRARRARGSNMSSPQ